jgi:hypothetical protein
MLPHLKRSDAQCAVIRGTAAHITDIARNGPLGADGWEMPVLLLEFFGGAPAAIPVANRLLRALSRDDLDPLRARLEMVPLPQKQTLSSPGTSIDHVYFPQEGMVSLVQPWRMGTRSRSG